MLLLSATDPANIFGGEVREALAPRFSRVPSTQLALWHGEPVVVFEDNGERLTTLAGTSTAVLTRALAAYRDRVTSGRLLVTKWNGGPVTASDGQPILKTLGFQSTPGGLAWWPKP